MLLHTCALGNTVTVHHLFVFKLAAFCEIPAKALSLSLYCLATCFFKLIWCILYIIKMQSKTKKTKIRLLRRSLSRQSSTERVPKWPTWPDTQMISKCCSIAAGRGFHPAALITSELCSTSWTKKVHVRLYHSFIFLLSCCPAHLVYCHKFTNLLHQPSEDTLGTHSFLSLCVCVLHGGFINAIFIDMNVFPQQLGHSFGVKRFFAFSVFHQNMKTV